MQSAGQGSAKPRDNHQHMPRRDQVGATSRYKRHAVFRNFYSRVPEFPEALDILNDGTLEQNTPAGHNRSKRDADEDLTNEERRVAGVRRSISVYMRRVLRTPSEAQFSFPWKISQCTFRLVLDFENRFA